MPGKRVKVTKESQTGRNVEFQDTKTGHKMTRPEFVRKIKQGSYPEYHVRNVNGVPTPVSNPDSTENNNLD